MDENSILRLWPRPLSLRSLPFSVPAPDEDPFPVGTPDSDPEMSSDCSSDSSSLCESFSLTLESSSGVSVRLGINSKQFHSYY